MDDDLLGVVRSRHLNPTPIKPAGAAPDDRWPRCRYARVMSKQKAERKRLSGCTLEELQSGKVALCYCRCFDSQGRHRRDHEDVLGKGRCFWCGAEVPVVEGDEQCQPS